MIQTEKTFTIAEIQKYLEKYILSGNIQEKYLPTDTIVNMALKLAISMLRDEEDGIATITERDEKCKN